MYALMAAASSLSLGEVIIIGLLAYVAVKLARQR